MRLVITEKPSVARDLARVLGVRGKRDGFLEGEGLCITWCIGHLLELEDPAHYDPAWKRWSLDTLPMVPSTFSLRVRKNAADQWRVVKRLLRDPNVREVVNACDAGREGELIFRQVYDHAGGRAPVLRFWVSSLTDDAIRRGWENLEPAARYDALGDAARCRSEADWIVGLNATRAMTCLARKAGGEQLLSVGRVQTPTLAMIVARDREIEAFVPQTFWQVKATFEAERDAEARWEATWFARDQDDRKTERKPAAGKDDEVPNAERIADQATADAVSAAARGRTGRIVEAHRKTQREAPPLLYDLTSLQRRANQRYGLSAQQTLAVAQTLYEKHKLITYPRTDARYLTPDQVGELPGILQGLAGLPVYAPFASALLEHPVQPGRRVVDASEVGDHHAILPTGRTPDASRLSPDERRVYDLVARRLLAALSPEAVFEQTVLVAEVDVGPDHALPSDISVPLHFRARGRVCRQAGWREVDPPGRSRELELPFVDEGEAAAVVDTATAEGTTRPPRPHSDASLLRGMETAGRDLDDAEIKRALRGAGLGTPATRAAILQTLLDRKYVRRDKRALHATERGRALIDAVPVPDLKNAALTGRWEARLSDVAEGREQRAVFMGDVAGYTERIVEAIRGAEPPPPETVARAPTPVLGDCPVCHTPVREGRGAFSCETGRECAFVVFKSMSKRKISARMVKQLLSSGRTPAVKGFKSKQGRPFEAGLEVGPDGKVGFWFPPRDGQGDRSTGRPAARSAERSADRPSERRPREGAPDDPVGLGCPACGQGRLVRGRAAWGCGRWREGCRFRVPFQVEGRDLGGQAAAALVSRGHATLGDLHLRLVSGELRVEMA